VDDDGVVFAWLRHYGLVIVLATVVGGLAGFAFAQLVPTREEAWTVVVETGGRIPPLQLGPVATAVFHSSAVYGPAMRSLGVTEPATRFLRTRTDLRPIPDTNTLLVVGFGRNQHDAQAVSGAMARSLIAAFADTGLSGFEIVGIPQPAALTTGVGTVSAVLFAATGFLWLAVGGALLHYRLRRPVISLDRATKLSEADRVATLRAGRFHPPRLRRLRWSDSTSNRTVIRELRAAGLGAARVVVPGVGRKTERRALRRVTSALHQDLVGGDGGSTRATTLLVAGPSSRQRDLRQASAVANVPPAHVALLWIG
jgi:hypothetical protein